MNFVKLIITLLLSACFVASAWAGVANDIPSCYAANKMKMAVPAPQTELFVLIDQTTPLDSSLQDAVRENADRLVKPGAAFVIASFSSFSQGRYLEVLSAGALESPIDDAARDDISVKVLRGFDACMADQAAFGRKAAAAAINRAMGASNPALAKSDVLGSLRELSARVRQSEARDRIVFIVSDMLENSSISSFYANRNVRAIDPKAELKKAQEMIGDFGGARVFVLGAGLVQKGAGSKNTDSGIYRDPKTISLLRQFWTAYFEASNAKLMEFGAPALLSPIK
ncbi:MAG: hypothetical protein FWF20_07595 [Betaproteobacteria bacterium]|nr:hypothetical protein [Betaproteobacteria bacterium]MCL2886632.1 hypothetical protein [Betaproteobacteria bacterium]